SQSRVYSTRRQIWISIARTCPFYTVLETAREVSLTNVQPTRGRKPSADHVYLKPGRNTVQQLTCSNWLTRERLPCS
ncbi:MAG: hypothetical protein WA183_16395, partial [Chthoniobacterales bacterium]